jgi:hypothetical protein
MSDLDKPNIRYNLIAFSKVPTGVNFRSRGVWFTKLGKYLAINQESQVTMSFIKPEKVGIMSFNRE